jgi:hypothetical protein
MLDITAAARWGSAELGTPAGRFTAVGLIAAEFLAWSQMMTYMGRP